MKRSVSFVYWHDFIFGFTEDGDTWEFVPPDYGGPTWRLLAHGPLPEARH